MVDRVLAPYGVHRGGSADSTGRRNTLTKTQKMACMLVNQRRHRGFTFPHRIEYMDGDGRSLAVETIDEFDLVVAAFELGQEVVAH